MHKFDKESCSNHIFRLDGEEVNVLLYAGGSSDVMQEDCENELLGRECDNPSDPRLANCKPVAECPVD